jgi:pyruvoyl-dependent arginine decarboxylase (PvlArgDC)
MSIPNVKRYRINSPDGSMTATLMAVLPKNIDVNGYLSEAAQRFDWKAYQEAQQKQFKIRVGQQKQKKAK